MTVSLQSQTVRVQGENQDKKEHKERESHIESRGSLKDLTFVKVVDNKIRLIGEKTTTHLNSMNSQWGERQVQV